MPRPRTTNRHHSFDDSLRVEVQVEDERLLISCGKGQDSVHWLADKVFQQYSAIRNEALGGKEVPAWHIKDIRTGSGALLAKDSRIAEVAADGDILRATVAQAPKQSAPKKQDGLGERLRSVAAQPSQASGGYLEAYGHNARIFDIAFSPIHSCYFATASDDGTAKIWLQDGQKSSQLASFHGHSDSVMCLSWSEDGTKLASGSADATVQIWRPNVDLQTSAGPVDQMANYGVEHLVTLKDHPEEVYAAHFLATHNQEALLSASKWVPYLWDIETCQQIAEGPFISLEEGASGQMPDRWKDGHIFSLQVMPNGGALAGAACSDGAVRLWRLGQGSRGLQGHAICEAHSKGMGSSCSWSPDGSKFASSATNGNIVILDIRMMGRICWQTKLSHPVFSCQFLPCSPHTLAVCGGGPDVSLLDTSSAASSEAIDSLLYAKEVPHRISSRVSASDSAVPDLNRHQDARSNKKLISQSAVVGPRNLLCLSASSDGLFIAASGEPAVLGQTNKSRGAAPHNGGNGKQNLRSSAELWALSQLNC